MTYIDLYKERQSVKAKLRKLRLKIDVQQFAELKERERKLTKELQKMIDDEKCKQKTI